MPDLILIRGLPGSGKSTLAKRLSKTHYHLEDDMYFERGGRYRYEPIKLGSARNWCLQTAAGSLREGNSVVVSNWFILNVEMDPYFELARALGIRISVIEAAGNYPNIHGIPHRTIATMRARWEPLRHKEALVSADVLR